MWWKSVESVDRDDGDHTSSESESHAGGQLPSISNPQIRAQADAPPFGTDRAGNSGPEQTILSRPNIEKTRVVSRTNVQIWQHQPLILGSLLFWQVDACRERGEVHETRWPKKTNTLRHGGVMGRASRSWLCRPCERVLPGFGSETPESG